MKIWILNHYAANMFFSGTGRHQAFAKYLMRMGHEVKIFCANTMHHTDKMISANGRLFLEKIGEDKVPYIFVRTTKYDGNGLSRIKNMYCFWKNVKRAVEQKAKEEGKPDVLLASSVHPLTLVAGIQLKDRLKIPCVCEIRDIWPLTLVEFKKIKKNGILHKMLLKLELWTYVKADKIIFTVEGGKQYIEDMGWDEVVNGENIYYINNGVDLERFDYNREHYIVEDEDLQDGCFKVIYSGSIGEANQLDKLLAVASEFIKRKHNKIKFIIYGDGPKRKELEEVAKNNKLANVVFKGKIDRKKIPFVLSKGDLTLFFIEDLAMYKYGLSVNKMFEYMAAGKPIVTNGGFGFNMIIRNNCGLTSDNLIQSIETMHSLSTYEYEEYCLNARKSSYQFSYEMLTKKLLECLENAKAS